MSGQGERKELLVMMVQVGRFECSCTEGWEGEDCTKDVDSCALEDRCHNGGVCVDLVRIDE